MINTLTSLRLIFAFMVFGAHCYVIDDIFSTHFFKEGFVGVSFFFVLSGFIIAYNYQKKLQEKEITRRRFWVARIARVYPLHWLTLFIAAILGDYVVASGGLDWCRHFLASLTLTHAYIPEADYYFSFNSPSWSLCCEQLFYICFPFLVPLTRNYKHLLYIFCVTAILLVVGMPLHSGRGNKGVLVCQSYCPLSRFHCRHVAFPIIRAVERQAHHLPTRKPDGNRCCDFILDILYVCFRNTQGIPVFLFLLASGRCGTD